MTTIDRITAVGVGSGISVGAPPGTLPAVDAAKAPANVVVAAPVRALLAKAGITPAPAGQKLDLSAVDAKLSQAGLDASQRMQVKTELARVGQLTPGRAIR
jgi:hypothetical protein